MSIVDPPWDPCGYSLNEGSDPPRSIDAKLLHEMRRRLHKQFGPLISDFGLCSRVAPRKCRIRPEHGFVEAGTTIRL